MSNFTAKNSIKAQQFTQKNPKYLDLQVSSKEEKYQNKIGYNPYNAEIKKIKQLQFDSNPVVVTRRNISTAQTKRHQYHDDDEDLLLTSNFNKKKQSNTYRGIFQQTTKQTIKKVGQRPQSKKQSRSHVWDTKNSLILKNTGTDHNRPQTSKGQRPKPIDKSRVSQVSHRKLSEQQYFPQQGETNDNEKKGIQTSRMLFKSSIDSDFLSLFAN